MFIVFTIGYVLLVCLGCIDDSKVGDLCDSLQKFLEQEKKAKEEEVQEQVEDTPEKNWFERTIYQ